MFSLTCSWAVGREESIDSFSHTQEENHRHWLAHSSLVRLGDKVPAVYSQEADKDSFNVVQKAGFRGHSGEKAKEAIEAQPLLTGSAGLRSL